MYRQNFSFTVLHHAWMVISFSNRAWDVLGKGEPLLDDVKEFVLHSLRLEPPPLASIVADCLLIAVGLVLGIKLYIDDCWLLAGGELSLCLSLPHETKSFFFAVMNPAFKSPGSTRSSPRRSVTPPRPPRGSTGLYSLTCRSIVSVLPSSSPLYNDTSLLIFDHTSLMNVVFLLLSIFSVIRVAVCDSLCTLLFCEFRVRGPGLRPLPPLHLVEAKPG